MAYKFNCTSCKSEIVSNYLKPGEELKCRACGTMIVVPENAQVVDTGTAPYGSFEVSPAKIIAEPVKLGKYAGKKAWNPRWLGLYSFFGSFLVAGILWIINYHRFGDQGDKQSAIIKFTGEILLLSVLEYLWGIPVWIYLLINIFNGIYFSVSQKHEFAKFIEEGGIHASFLKLISLQVGVAIVAIIVAAVLISREAHQADRDFKAMEEFVREGNFEQAFVIAAKWDRSYPRTRFLWFSHGSNTRGGTLTLAWKLLEVGVPDSALAVVNRSIQFAPADTVMVISRHAMKAAVLAKERDYNTALAEVNTYLESFPNAETAQKLKSKIEESILSLKDSSSSQ